MLDLQESPEEIKSREVELGLRVGLLLLQLFPNGGATDIVFVTLFSTAAETVTAWCCSCWAMPGGHCLNILLFWWRSTAAFFIYFYFYIYFFCINIDRTAIRILQMEILIFTFSCNFRVI